MLKAALLMYAIYPFQKHTFTVKIYCMWDIDWKKTVSKCFNYWRYGWSPNIWLHTLAIVRPCLTTWFTIVAHCSSDMHFWSLVRTPSPRQPSGKDHWNQWSPYNLTLLQLEQTTDSSGRRGTAPPTEPGFSQGFFSILSPMEFWFLAAVASGLLSWGHFISSDITDLIE